MTIKQKAWIIALLVMTVYLAGWFMFGELKRQKQEQISNQRHQDAINQQYAQLYILGDKNLEEMYRNFINDDGRIDDAELYIIKGQAMKLDKETEDTK